MTAKEPFDSADDNKDRPDSIFDPARLRKRQKLDATKARIQLEISVSKPGKFRFFRIHPNPEYQVPALLFTYEREMDKQHYFISPDFLDSFPELLDILGSGLKEVTLYTGITRQGNLFLWPVGTSMEGPGGKWNSSAHQVVQAGISTWVQLRSNIEIGAYDLVPAAGDLGEPEWPDLSLQQILERAFRNSILDRPDHPLIQELEGRI